MAGIKFNGKSFVLLMSGRDLCESLLRSGVAVYVLNGLNVI